MTVKATIEHLLANMDEEAIIEDERTMTFSIRMRESDHELLTYLADFFRMKKTPFADMLLRDAMHETLQTIARRRAGSDDPHEANEIFLQMLDQAHGQSAKEAS